MKKIAVCFTGHLRTSEHTVDNFLRFFGEFYPYIDIFIHTWDKNENKIFYRASKKALEIFEKNSIDPNDYRNHKHLLQPFPAPDTTDVVNALYKKYKNKIVSVTIERSENQLISPRYIAYRYAWYKIIEKVIEHEKLFDFKYDVVIKTRPDIVFPRDVTLSREINNFLLDTNGFYSQRYNHINLFGAIFHMAKSDIMKKTYEYVLSCSKQIPNAEKGDVVKYLNDNGINLYTTYIKEIAVYRPETIPTSSLNYERCYNIDQDWYWSANNKFRYPETDD